MYFMILCYSLGKKGQNKNIYFARSLGAIVQHSETESVSSRVNVLGFANREYMYMFMHSTKC